MTTFAHSPATDTREIVLPFGSRALPEAPTDVIPVPYCKPEPSPRRWSFLARTLTALLLADAAGVLYVAVQR